MRISNHISGSWTKYFSKGIVGSIPANCYCVPKQFGYFKGKETKVFTKNNIFQKFEVLKTNRNKRYRYHEFFVEGVRSLNEAVRNSWTIKSFIYDKNNLSDWSGKEDTSERMAVIEMREDSLKQITLSEKPFIVLFDRPSNKGNLGTMIRTWGSLQRGLF